MDGGNYILMTSRLQAMQVYCPECGAAIDEACLLAYERNGRIYRRACHRERHQLYQKNRGVKSMARIVRENAGLVAGDPFDPFGDEAKLKAVYAEFADEEVALANEGLAEFRQAISDAGAVTGGSSE